MLLPGVPLPTPRGVLAPGRRTQDPVLGRTHLEKTRGCRSRSFESSVGDSAVAAEENIPLECGWNIENLGLTIWMLFLDDAHERPVGIDMGSWLRRPKSLTLSLAILFGLIPTDVSGEVTPALVTQERGVFSRVNAVEVGSAAEFARADEAKDFDPYSVLQFPVVSTLGATAGAQGSMGSDLDGSDLFVSAGVSATILTTMPVVRAEASGDASFDVVFDLTDAASYELTGSLDVNSMLGIANASVELIDVSSGSLLASHSVDTLGQEIISDTGNMMAGLRYRLRASAVVDTSADAEPGTAFADASYEITLTLLPEPARGASLLAGLLLIRVLRRRRP
jgi:hypothetical protein